jgi:hypothetical protein
MPTATMATAAGSPQTLSRFFQELAMHNSQPGADVVQQAPVPRWGWGVAPPYQP